MGSDVELVSGLDWLNQTIWYQVRFGSRCLPKTET